MKITSKFESILADIKKLINIDLTKVSTQVKRAILNVDTDNLSYYQIGEIKEIGKKYLNYRVESNGHKRIALILTTTINIPGVK